MPDGDDPLPFCQETNYTPIDDGTLCIAASETPTPVGYSAPPTSSVPEALFCTADDDPAAFTPIPPTDDRQHLITAQDKVRNDIKYYKDSEGQTHCNLATRDIVKALGGPIAPLVDKKGVPLLANDQAANLAASPLYKEVTPQEAQIMANDGKLVIAAYKNPQGHGHVATVRPDAVEGDSPYGQTGPVINDIGANHRVAHRSGVFSADKEVHYYAPK